MRTLKYILVALFSLLGLLVIGLESIAEICNQDLPFLELIDKNPMSTFAIFTSILLLFVGKHDKNIHSHLGSILICGAIMFLFFTTFVKGDTSLKFCVVAGITFMAYYVMYNIGRKFQPVE